MNGGIGNTYIKEYFEFSAMNNWKNLHRKFLTKDEDLIRRRDDTRSVQFSVFRLDLYFRFRPHYSKDTENFEKWFPKGPLHISELD